MKLKKWMKRTKKTTMTHKFETTRDAKKAYRFMADALNEYYNNGHVTIKLKGKEVSIICDAHEVFKFWKDSFEV